MLQNMFPVSFDELQKILDLHIMNYSTEQPTPAINIKCLHIIIEDWFDVLHETMFLFLVRNYLENVLNVCVLREKRHRERRPFTEMFNNCLHVINCFVVFLYYR